MLPIFARLLSLALFVLVVAAHGEDVQLTLTGPSVDQIAEGRSYDITWESSGVEKISVFAKGDHLFVPGNKVEELAERIVESGPADEGMVTWSVPFLDTLRFRIEITGYDDDGEKIAEDSRTYTFRPEVLRKRTADGIFIDLGNPERQRLYRLQDNIVTHAYIISGSRTGVFLPKTSDSSQPHDHVGVFRVSQKSPMYWSNTYSVWMTHAMRFWKGHFIHGTYPDQYYLLGRPASSGCIRMHRTDAEELFGITPEGTRVEIFGNLN